MMRKRLIYGFKHTIRFIVMMICVSIITIQIIQFQNLIVPVKDFEDYAKINMIKKDLIKLGASKEEANIYSKPIKIASEVTSIDNRIISSITKVESNFKIKAVSSKGYKGLMQTRVASMEHPEVDVMMGAKELQKWIKYRGGDLEYALASYNGGTYPPKSSWSYAKKIIILAQNL